MSAIKFQTRLHRYLIDSVCECLALLFTQTPFKHKADMFSNFSFNIELSEKLIAKTHMLKYGNMKKVSKFGEMSGVLTFCPPGFGM